MHGHLAGRRVDRDTRVVRKVHGPPLLRFALLAGVLGCAALGCTASEPIPETSPQPASPQPPSTNPAGLIAFVSDREGVEALYLMQANGTEVRRLTRSCLRSRTRPGRWTGDGWRSTPGSPRASDIYLISSDGSGLTQVTRDAAANFYPSWSPDGRRLAFSSNRDGDWDIFVMDVDGSNVRQLVNSPGLDDKPQWSPDGSRIGFATTRSGTPELRAVDPATGVEEPLLPQPVSGINPAWTADGSRLAYNVVTSAGFDIAVVAPDGTESTLGCRRVGVGGTTTMVAGRPVARVLLGRGRVRGTSTSSMSRPVRVGP